MTYTGRIRLSLILIAVLPVMIVMAMIWHQYNSLSELEGQRLARNAIEKFDLIEESVSRQLKNSTAEYALDRSIKATVANLSRKSVSRLTVRPDRYGLDFAEIITAEGIVRASYHRPGLLDRKIELGPQAFSDSLIIESIEYDLNGPHAAVLSVSPVSENLYLYAGIFIDNELLDRMTQMTGAKFKLIVEPETELVYSSMATKMLYQTDTGYQAVMAGAEAVGYYLVADFSAAPTDNDSGLINLLGLAGLVGLLSVIISIAAGMYITGRTKREIDNLVEATTRVARGDLTTPIMAYEEGEFSQLADSFSEMMVDLKKLQIDLANTEKIAAWQSMGRKIAHEIRNPMTPIAISVDDLRQSYHDKLENFDQILDQTTSMIRSEVARLSRLLDEFVSFAKMAPPVIKIVELDPFLDDLRGFYRREIENNQLMIASSIDTDSFHLDRDAIWQVLINLIKNAFEATCESERATKITLRLESLRGQLTITVEDNGPGFSAGQLSRTIEPQISTKKSGSGLGLVICQRIVIDHGGSMKIYNNSRGGAGVRISLHESSLPEQSDA